VNSFPADPSAPENNPGWSDASGLLRRRQGNGNCTSLNGTTAEQPTAERPTANCCNAKPRQHAKRPDRSHACPFGLRAGAKLREWRGTANCHRSSQENLHCLRRRHRSRLQENTLFGVQSLFCVNAVPQFALPQFAVPRLCPSAAVPFCDVQLLFRSSLFAVCRSAMCSY
jgi:hypothetical protein